MLTCSRLKGRHTAENIFQEYENTVTSFNISSKVKHVITDHAKNMLNAFTLPGYMEEEENSDVSDEEEDTTTSEVNSDYNYSFDVLPVQHHGCFAHSLQLVIKDGFKQGNQVNRVISKCSKIVSFVCRSTIAAEVLEGEKKLEIANATRWNSNLK